MTAFLSLCNELGQQLRHQNKWLAVAESCTGGLLAAALTSVPGSSAWFERGLVTYSNEAKQDLLKVPADLIAAQGAVSGGVVCAMAEGLLKVAPVDFSIAVSGIAGPDGGSADKPVGTVWVAWGRKNQAATSHLFHFEGDRAAVREAAVVAALQGLLDRL